MKAVGGERPRCSSPTAAAVSPVEESTACAIGAMVFHEALRNPRTRTAGRRCLVPALQAQVPMSTESADPYLWLEEVDGARALDFAGAASTRTLSELKDPEFAQIRDEVREVLDSRERDGTGWPCMVISFTTSAGPCESTRTLAPHERD